MKIRIYSPYYPEPVTEGAFQVISDQARCLAEIAEVEIVVWKESAESLKSKTDRSDLMSKISLVHWESQSESGLMRALRVSKGILGAQASPEIFYYPPEMDRRDELGRCDLAIYHYSFSASWVRKRGICRERRKVVHLHNLESDLALLRFQNSAPPLSWIHRLNALKLRRTECELSQVFDELWFLSEPDKLRWMDFGVGESARLQVRPPTYQEKVRRKRSQEFLDSANKSQPVVGFIGGLDFEPNRASVDWLLRHVCPVLKSRQFLGRIFIAGHRPPSSLLALAKPFPFVSFLGFVDNVEKFWGSLSLMLVPHRVGSGVRIKLLEGLASGVPVLCNSAATKMIHAGLCENPLLLVRDKPEEWADVIQSDLGFHLRLEQAEAPLSEELRGSNVYRDIIDGGSGR